MKTLLLALAATIFFHAVTNAQTVNGVPLKDLDVEYVQIVGETVLFSNKITVALDFGQENKTWGNKEFQLKDVNGKKIQFNSMIDALNFMTRQGFEFVQAYAMNTSSQGIYHYLLRKKKASL